MNWREVTFETISYFKRCDQKPSIPTMNIHILEALQYTQCDYVKNKTLAARKALAENDKESYYNLKQDLPCVTFSGGFVTTQPRKISNGAPTHTIVLDIDHIKSMNKTVDEVKNLLFTYPSVYWVQTSCSGDGVFALVRIKDPDKRKEYYNWFENDLKEKYNIILDKLDDITRLRFLSWDDKPLAKEEIVECVNTLEITKKTNYENIELSVYKRAYQEIREKHYKVIWEPKKEQVEHLSHPDRMMLFNSLRCIYNDDKQQVMQAWKECMHRMEYSQHHNTKLEAALEEPIKNNWFDYNNPHISYKIVLKFYNKKEAKKDETE